LLFWLVKSCFLTPLKKHTSWHNALWKWSHVRFESWGNFQNESISKKSTCVSVDCPGSNQRPQPLKVASLPSKLSWFNIHNLKIGMFVCTNISCFQSLMDLEPLWQVDAYQQNVFCMGQNKADTHISNQNLVSFVSMRIQKKFNFSVSRSNFDSRCKPGVFISWMEFDFCFAIENFRSFKTVTCSTNSSSDSLLRDAEHIRSTAFRWRCDEVKMRGTCLEAQKSMQIKVVINSWKLYYDTEDTFKKKFSWEFFDIRRNGKVLLWT